MKWEPEDYCPDPIANALLNIAEALHRQATATDNLLYALKYSKGDGLSIAEAIEVAANKQAEALSEQASAIADLASAVRERD